MLSTVYKYSKWLTNMYMAGIHSDFACVFVDILVMLFCQQLRFGVVFGVVDRAPHTLCLWIVFLILVIYLLVYNKSMLQANR